MSAFMLGKTLVIANPASHSGKGAAAAGVVDRILASYGSATTSYEVWSTSAPGDAEGKAREASSCDTVLAIGGDGIIHEVVCGLMALPENERPRLGVIPMGSGNDFARTLGLSINDPEASLAQLLGGGERCIDLGFVASDVCPEGTYFAETLSFGLDAAIAIDTTERRSDGTRQEGSALFATSALKMFSKAREGYPCTVSLDGDKERELTELVFAVQNGPTYGGGFRICPQASPTDGLLDVCYNIRHPWVPHLLFLLGLARFGRHTGSRAVRLRRMTKAHLSFANEPPCQVDGEELRGSEFEVSVAPQALRVLVPRTCRW